MRQKVLVIDDSPMVTSLIRSRLSDEPIDVHVAANGPQGLTMAADVRPDLILLDVEMPQPNGFAVCRELKSRPATMQIPVVFLIGVSSSEEKTKCLDLGAIDFLTKPFDPAELRACVRAALRTKYLIDLLASKAQVDGLTGLWNRSYFEQRLASEISLSRRTNDDLSCMKVDLDDFKRINERFGHPAGDEVIRAAAQSLSSCVRLEDIVCRYGGDEFAVILPNTSAERAAVLAERMRRSLTDRPLHFRGQTLTPTASFGVSAVHPTIEATLQHADAAVARAKQLGCNRVECAAGPAARLLASTPIAPTAKAS